MQQEKKMLESSEPVVKRIFHLSISMLAKIAIPEFVAVPGVLHHLSPDGF